MITRPYTPRSVASPSLARIHRIFELHHRIADKLAAFPEAEWQREQNLAIAERAKRIREIRELEARMARADRLSLMIELKRQLRFAQEDLASFDQALEVLDFDIPSYAPEPAENIEDLEWRGLEVYL